VPPAQSAGGGSFGWQERAAEREAEQVEAEAPAAVEAEDVAAELLGILSPLKHAEIAAVVLISGRKKR
jgi:hypothetical protein